MIEAAFRIPAFGRHIAAVALIGAVIVSMGQMTGTAIAQNGSQIIETERERLRLVQVAGDLRHPWAVAFLPDGTFLVTERPGRLLHVTRDGDRHEIPGLPEVGTDGQGGLLDVALHPRFSENRWIYLTYSAIAERSRTTTALARARLKGVENGNPRLVGMERIFIASKPVNSGRHFGSRIAFSGDGHLFISVGERGDPDRAQDLSDHAGSILRLNHDGSAPDDNPFAGREGALPEIWSYGHRNPQGMFVHPQTGQLWANEHGPRGGDEINRIEPGINYGWPVISHGADYITRLPIGIGTNAPGMKPPLHHWTPSIAPSGFAVYTGDRFPAWRDDLFTGALAGQHLRRSVLSENRDAVVHEEVLLEGRIGRIRDVRQGPDGNIYLLTDEDPGGLYRLEPAGS